MENLADGAVRSGMASSAAARSAGPSTAGKPGPGRRSGSLASGAGVVHTVTKKDLIDRISDRTKIKRQDVKTAIQEFLDQVVSELQAGNRLEFRDFGVFEIKARAPRVAQNPKTLERVDVPAKRTVKFKIGRLMRESLEQNADKSRDSGRPHMIGSSSSGHLGSNGTAGSKSKASA